MNERLKLSVRQLCLGRFWNQTWLLPREIVNNIDVITRCNIY
jgi:hypothetical protein